MDYLRRLIEDVFGSDAEHPLSRGSLPVPTGQAVQLPPPIQRKVLMITHNPVLKSQGGRTLKQHFGWQDPDWLAQEYINDIKEISYGYANYEVVERLIVDAYPLKRDGFHYTEQSYLEAWRQRKFHEPDGVDYLELVREFDLIRRVDSGEIDEVWLFGHPYGGYWESIMAGPGAFWCNAPPLDGTRHCSRRFIIMGFNFERGVGEMLEDLGHRAESILYKVFERTHSDSNLFEKFTRYDQKYPGAAEVGNVHFAPNSLKDYDWGNPRPVLARCDSWLNFPDLSEEPRTVTCADWGHGDIRAHHKWWFARFPHIIGESNSIAWNWWQYVIDPNRVP